MSRYEPQYEEQRSGRVSEGVLSAIGPAALTLLGGLALGAGAMYLMDPDEGHYRRRYIRRSARGAFEAAGDRLGSAYGSVADTASSFRDRASDWTSSAGHLFHRGSRHGGRELGRWGRGLGRRGRDYIMEYDEDEGGHGFGSILSLLLGGSVLAGVIYLLTSEFDSIRRGDFRGAASHAYHRAGDVVSSSTQFARDKATRAADRATVFLSKPGRRHRREREKEEAPHADAGL